MTKMMPANNIEHLLKLLSLVLMTCKQSTFSIVKFLTNNKQFDPCSLLRNNPKNINLLISCIRLVSFQDNFIDSWDVPIILDLDCNFLANDHSKINQKIKYPMTENTNNEQSLDHIKYLWTWFFKLIFGTNSRNLYKSPTYKQFREKICNFDNDNIRNTFIDYRYFERQLSYWQTKTTEERLQFAQWAEKQVFCKTEFVLNLNEHKQLLNYHFNQPQLSQTHIHKQSEDHSIIETPYLTNLTQNTLKYLKSSVFQHFFINGPQQSGKMTFIRLLDQKFHPKNKAPNFIVVTLEETFDSKNLVGTYICDETGQFIFKKGPLTVAAEKGLWLILRNIEKAPADLLSFLLPLVQENQLQVTSKLVIKPKLGFRMFAIGRQVSEIDDDINGVKPFLNSLMSVSLQSLSQRDDFKIIIKECFPALDKLTWIKDMLLQTASFVEQMLNQMKGQLLDCVKFSVRHTLKLLKRANILLESIGDDQTVFLSSQLIQSLIQEITEIFLGHLYSQQIFIKIVKETIQVVINPYFNSHGQAQVHAQDIVDYLLVHGRQFNTQNKQNFYFGRSYMNVYDSNNYLNPEQMILPENDSKYVFTASTQRLAERICMAIKKQEPILMVGETGTGKTSLVQQIAKLSNREIHVFNMNQNTDSSDLLGGFKPVDFKFLLKPIYSLFLKTFNSLFKQSSNQQYLDLIQKCYENNQLKEFVQCLIHGVQSIKSKKQLSDEMQSNVSILQDKINDLQKRTRKLESTGGFIFQFIEGQLIKCMQNGTWILLDEINLANDSVLNKLATIIDGNHILLNERADIVETKIHPDFRVFMCMNPPYTSAGKKQLPSSLRGKLTEIYVEELNQEHDLWPIIDQNAPLTMFSENQRRSLLYFYLEVKIELQKLTRSANIGLRNLMRALKMMRQSILLKYPVVKAIYDSLMACFSSHLDLSLQNVVNKLILSCFQIKQIPRLTNSENNLNSSMNYVQVGDFVIIKGNYAPNDFNQHEFIVTKSFESLVNRLASIVAVSDYAVILEGPTSAGKTSVVEYLAKTTHNKITRINNHMHTDIQEYIGSYIPSSSDGGKLIFQEGVLVEAVRNGHWVILDELNLAPSEVLEALNRLLDDNRELHIVETQQTIKAHPNFRIFATQNPTEGYGGRKELSQAFKNRFIMIKVTNVPSQELIDILIQKCELPKSRASLMVKTMDSLQIYRSQANLFAGKNSTITVRDLLKWGQRLRGCQDGMPLSIVAQEGFLVLGERCRNNTDKQYIIKILNITFKCKLNLETFYEDQFDRLGLQKMFTKENQQTYQQKLIITTQLKRLAVLVFKCLQNKEPILLVGETGCGKTSLCQVFAEFNNQDLYSINCHQNTETSDFIGCMRTRKNIQLTQKELKDNLDKAVGILDQIGGFDSTFHQKIEKQQSLKQQASLTLHQLKLFKQDSKDILVLAKAIRQNIADLNKVFEWQDGILVESMKKGGLLLIDEISLVNDSVLERLNSVFEQERTLTLSEKSSSEAVKIKANNLFNIIATMNPSGDFGKKELSPALRNRMTEIWVETCFTQTQLLDLASSFGPDSLIATNPLIPQINNQIEQIDLFKIINQLTDQNSDLSLCILNIMIYILFPLTQAFSCLQRKPLSIRDVISCIEFVKQQKTLFSDIQQNQQMPVAVFHAINLVVIDGLFLGIDIGQTNQKKQILKFCQNYLKVILKHICSCDFDKLPMEYLSGKFVNTEIAIGVTPFLLDKRYTESNNNVPKFAFDASTTKSNLHKLLRAYQLNKPILIEGAPGVGKTSLVENLAKISGRKIQRVNLSEQTDMMDLLGSEYPCSQQIQPSKLNQDQQANPSKQEIQFKWCDGILLQAIKEGHWFLIDEMNLAQQSVLEGLNAILDHRRVVYIPELNQEFKCHPDFFVFACQNPSQSATSVGGRKSLPKSFLNRFNKIYLDELNYSDYRCILQQQMSIDHQLQSFDVDKLLNLTNQLQTFKRKNNKFLILDDESINLRDLQRFIKIFKQLKTSTLKSNDICLAQSIEICYLQGLNLEQKLQAIQQILLPSGLVANTNEICLLFKLSPKITINPQNQIIIANQLPTCIDSAEQSLQFSTLSVKNIRNLQGSHTRSFQTLINCIESNLPILVVSNNCHRFLQDLKTLSNLYNRQLNRILLNVRSDMTQLLGCFEQTGKDLLQVFFNQVLPFETIKDPANILNLIRKLEQIQNPSDYKQLLCSDQCKLSTKSKKILLDYLEQDFTEFEWVDSTLVSSIEQGAWAVFENANICSASILDRINSLLEEGNNSMVINEQGLTNLNKLRKVTSHQNFRAIFLIDKCSLRDKGRDVSRALRNRCIEVLFDYEISSLSSDSIKSIDETILSITEINEAIQSLPKYQDSFIIDGYYSQILYDMLPLQDSKIIPFGQVVPLNIDLGKRNRPKLDSQISQDIQPNQSINFEDCLSYLFEYLSQSSDIQCLNSILSDLEVNNPNSANALKFGIEKQNDANENLLFYYLNKVLMDQISNYCKQSREFVEEATIYVKNLIKMILDNGKTKLAKQSQLDLHYLLSQISQKRNRLQFNLIEPEIIYSMMQIGIQIEIDSNWQLQEKLGPQLLQALTRNPNNLRNSFEILKGISINYYSNMEIQNIISINKQMLDINQGPLADLWVKDVSSNDKLQIKTGWSGLISQFSVMLMDDDKELKSVNKIDYWQVEEMIATRSPYLILIPLNQGSTLLSQSNLYRPMCFFKDFLVIKKALNALSHQPKQFQNYRLSYINPICYNISQKSNLPYLLAYHRLKLNNKNNSDQLTNDVILQCITAVIHDENQCSLRDMPAFFYNSAKLARQLNKILDQNNMEQDVFWKQVKSNLQVVNPQISNSLSQDSTLKELFDNNFERAIEAFQIMNESALSIINSNTIKILEAIIILPFEIKRKQHHYQTQKQFQLIGKLRHDYYHLSSWDCLTNIIPSLNNLKHIKSDIQYHINMLPENQRQQIYSKSSQSNLNIHHLLKIVTEVSQSVAEWFVFDKSDPKSGLLSILSNKDCQINMYEQVCLIEYQLEHLIFKQSHIYLEYAHLLDDFLKYCLSLVVSTRRFLLTIPNHKQKLQEITQINLSVIDSCKTSQSYLESNLFITKQIAHWRKTRHDKCNEYNMHCVLLYENYQLLTLKTSRILRYQANIQPSVEAQLHILDYFVQREVAKKMAEEDQIDQMEQQVLKVPFKMKVQSIMDDNKAIDERTKKDKLEAEKAAALEIEENFPSYFDELSRQMLSIMADKNQIDIIKDTQKLSYKPQEVNIDQILFELGEIDDEKEAVYKAKWLKLNLQCQGLDIERCNWVQKNLREQINEVGTDIVCKSFDECSQIWMEDALICLNDQINNAQVKAVMNISDVNLPSTYNFYHDAYPQEARLFYYPLSALQTRVRDILKEYQSPILNDLLFLTNYMLSSFNSLTTPLMKMLTGMELLLEKLDEWDSYSSRKLNSCEEQTQKIKQLIIRYRKLQILSWRNLLQHKKQKMIRQDLENCLRFIYTVQRQVFDPNAYRSLQQQHHQSKKNQTKKHSQQKQNQTQKVELDIFSVIDLFIRESSLGVFESRLRFLRIFQKDLEFKQQMLIMNQTTSKNKLVALPKYQGNIKNMILQRLHNVVNIVGFVVGYYSQFGEKLNRTIARLDNQARDKIKTLIDVSKWSLQKFSQVKNNIDKTHRQLNKACKLEEEILLQNIQTLVLTSSRKKYIFTDDGGDKLISLDSERNDLLKPTISLHASSPKIQNQVNIIQQLNYFQKNQIVSNWPDATCLDTIMEGLFERLQIVRDINLKHVQRKALIDLLKFMKVQGLQSNFQDDLQPWIMKAKLVASGNDSLQKRLNKYFFKAHELMLIMNSSSQTSENSDLRNIDILRMKGFSMSLMQKLLQVNESIQQMTNLKNKLSQIIKDSVISKLFNSDEMIVNQSQQQDVQFNVTSSIINKAISIQNDFKHLISNFVEQLSLIQVLEGNPNPKIFDTSFLNQCNILQNQNLKGHTEKSNILNIFDQNQPLKLACQQSIEQVIKLESELTFSRRSQQLLINTKESLNKLFIQADIMYQEYNNIQNYQSNLSIQQPEISLPLCVNKITKMTQLIYQGIYKVIVRTSNMFENEKQESEKERKESFDQSTIAAISTSLKDKSQQQLQIDVSNLSIVDQAAFTEEISNIFNTDIQTSKNKSNVSVIEYQIKQFDYMLTYIKRHENSQVFNGADIEQLKIAQGLLLCIQNNLEFIIESQSTYLCSLCKFSYLTQRIFVYLIFQGFCGLDSKDNDEDEDQKQQEADDKYLDGQGMGDGQGQNNVSNEIEHQEQLEGLKNYESEDEQQQNQQQDQEPNQEEDQNDFEMQDDFDGQLHDEEQKDDDKQDDDNNSNDQDDQIDQVDDMLDNDLWDQNMQDMQDQEDKNHEEDNQKDREIDLGDRDIDQQNLMDQKDKEITAGDHEQQKEKEKQEKQQSELDEAKDEDMQQQLEDDSMQDNQEQSDEAQTEQDLADMPLNRPEQVEDQQEEQNNDQDQPDDANSDDNLDQQLKDEMDSIGTEENPDDIEQPDGDEASDSDQQVDEKTDEHMEERDYDMQNDNQNQDDELDEQQSNKSASQIGDDDQDKEVSEANSNTENQHEQDQQQENQIKKGADQNLNQNQNENEQNQSKTDQIMQTQFDVEGNDILFQLAQKIQFQQEKKQAQKQQQMNQQPLTQPEDKDQEMKQVEQPQIADKDDNQIQQDENANDEEGEAVEYKYDEEQAEQMQGKLATDQLAQDLDHQMPDEDQQDIEKQSNPDNASDQHCQQDHLDQNIQKTEQALNQKQVQDKSQQQNNHKQDKQQQQDQQMQDQQLPIDLVQQYQEYLEKRQKEKTHVNEQDEHDMEIDQVGAGLIKLGSNNEFDYNIAKQQLRVMFDEWRSDQQNTQQSMNLLNQFKQVTTEQSGSLCEQLRIVLEPQLSQSLQGDFKTGKRLNMKKVISFIASHYRNDKIWLRRTLPSKRDYKILIAIDDSLSMKEQNLGFFSLEAMVTLVEALNRLEVGQVAIARIRDRLELVQSFEDTYSNERTAFVVNQYDFNHNSTNSLDLAMANFLRDANKLLDLQNTSSQIQGGMSCPFTIIISDGRFNKQNIVQYIQEAQEKRYLYIFVILDTPGKNSIMNLKSATKSEDGKSMKIEPYLKDFPFSYYCVVSDLHELPNALSSILVQWFSIVTAAPAY